MVKSLVRNYLINVVGLWLVSQYIGGFQLAEGLKSLLVVAAGFTGLHLILKPVLKLFLGPINLLTLGLIDLVIDSGLLFLLTLYFPEITISAWTFPGFESTYLTLPPYELTTIMVTVISAFGINVVRSMLLALEE